MSPEHEEVAEVLLEKARGDLAAARELAAAEGHPDHVIGFHLQQAVEKGLKAILAITAVEIPHTHSLVFISDLVAEAGVEMPDAVVRAAAALSPWGVVFRYDEESEDLDRDAGFEAATAAVSFAEETFAERRSS